MDPYYSDEYVTILHGDNRDFVGSADVVITDPPYSLAFMGKEWDKGIPTYWDFDAGWLFAFGGTRTFHRLMCAIEDAGWQYRDTIAWIYGQGFPKGKNALKPAWEPITVARKYGDLDIDVARIPTTEECARAPSSIAGRNCYTAIGAPTGGKGSPLGRWPANLILDEEAGAMLDEQSGELQGPWGRESESKNDTSWFSGKTDSYGKLFHDTGGASRFFYCAKASKAERGEGNDHPTVKPLKLMEYLITLSGGQTILDPFMGSGTTLVAAKRLGRKAIGVEIDEHSCEIAANRCKMVLL